MHDLIVPPPLKAGDTVAIVSPSGCVSADVVARASAALRSEGCVVRLGQHCLDRHDDGVMTFGGKLEHRLADLHAAFADPEVKAVLCARGGYGAVQLLAHADMGVIADNPKWLIGYSDITALHSVMLRAGVVSLHAPMARHLAECGTKDAVGANVGRVLCGGKELDYDVEGEPENCHGKASGMLVGGNLAVLDALVGTEFDMVRPGSILFVEDVGDEVYRVERILYHWLLTGALAKLGGLVVGNFSRYRESASGKAMRTTIRNMVASFGYPVAFGFPVGHSGGNVPLVEGADAVFEVSGDAARLRLMW